MHIALPKHGGSPLLERFRIELIAKNLGSPAQQAMATDAACQVIQFLCATLEHAEIHAPKLELWVPGASPYLPIRIELGDDCFDNARMSLFFSGVFVSAAVAAAWLPEKFTFFEMVSVLDEAAWHEQRSNRLAPRYPFSRTLSEQGKEKVASWLRRTPYSDFPLVATLVAFDLSGHIYHAQRLGFEHLATITPVPLEFGKTYEIGGARGSTVTEAALRAAKRACDLMRSAGIDNGGNIPLHHQQSSWKWLVENGLRKCLMGGAEEEDLSRYCSLVEQERQKWEKEEAAAGRCPKCESPVPPVWVALNGLNPLPPPSARPQLSAPLPGGDHIHYDNCTFTGGSPVAKQDIKFDGQVTAGNLVIADKIEESLIQNAGSPDTPAPVRGELDKLAKALAALAPSLDAAAQRQAAEDFGLLAKEAARPAPRKHMLKATGEALLATVAAAGALAEPVGNIVSAIYKLCEAAAS